MLFCWQLVNTKPYSLQDYIEYAEKLYNAKVERVDFTNDIEDTRHKINKWIENETHGECDAVFLQICQFYVNTENCQL